MVGSCADSAVRFILFVMPWSVMSNLLTHTILQMMCDLLPELLFFSCYIQLLTIWFVHVFDRADVCAQD